MHKESLLSFRVLVDIPIVSGETCSHVMSLPSKESVFCGGDLFHGGKDACQGDSGGPMVQERNGRFEVPHVVLLASSSA